MDAGTLINVISERFRTRSADLTSWNEWQLQLRITDALLHSGQKVFMEYPYPDGRDACDIVVTEATDCEIATDWIELKPIMPGYFYWGPSKFIVEASFKHDIRKLASIGSGRRWFVTMMVTDSPEIGRLKQENPRHRKKLLPGQIVDIISFWARRRPVQVKSFPAGDVYCHVVLWNVEHCCEDHIRIVDGEYVLPGLERQGNAEGSAKADPTGSSSQPSVP